MKMSLDFSVVCIKGGFYEEILDHSIGIINCSKWSGTAVFFMIFINKSTNSHKN